MKQQLLSTFIILLAVLVISSSCEKEVFLDFDYKPELCLNCILNPAETIEASVTLSRSINDTGSFTPVTNAVVELYENDILIGQLTPSGGGKYLLNRKPLVGKNYRITVQSEGFKTLTAFSIVPKPPDINWEKINYRNDESNFERYDLSVELHDPPGKDYYWLYTTFNVNGIESGGGNYTINSPYVDNFNKQYDNYEKFGFTYFMQIRMTDEGYDGQVMKFTVPDIPVMIKTANQHFLSADENYDKYIKTTIINRMKEESEFPFYEPVKIYSNIENGTGIFGSCAITTVKLQ